MKRTFRGWEVRTGVEAAAHKICSDMGLPTVRIVWSSKVSTAAINSSGKMYLADIRDDATISRALFNRYVGYIVHELLHRKYTNFAYNSDKQYIQQLHNAIEDIWIERKGIAAKLTGNIGPLLTELIGQMVAEALAAPGMDWTAVEQYPFVLAVFGRRYAPPVPVAQGLLPIFIEASSRVDDCASTSDTLVLAKWVYDQLQQTLPPDPRPAEPKPGDQPGDKPGDKPGDQPGEEGKEGAGKGQEGPQGGAPGDGKGKVAGNPGKAQRVTSADTARETEPGARPAPGDSGSGTYDIGSVRQPYHHANTYGSSSQNWSLK